MGSNGNHFYDMEMESPLEGNFDIGKTILRVSVHSRTQKMEAIISCPYAGLGHCPEGQGPDTV